MNIVTTFVSFLINWVLGVYIFRLMWVYSVHVRDVEDSRVKNENVHVCMEIAKELFRKYVTLLHFSRLKTLTTPSFSLNILFLERKLY